MSGVDEPWAGESPTEDGANGVPLRRSQLLVLWSTVMIVAMCGIVYELLIATISSYLIGNSVYQFSITVGLFMAAMGLGAYLSRAIRGLLLEAFITVETILALVGGVSSMTLFMVFPYSSLYTPVMWGLILIIGTLVGLEIPIIVRILASRGGVRRGISDALSLDYLGALVGSVAFPLLMLPHLGLLRSSFAIGLLNALVAIVNVIAFRSVLRRPGLLLGVAAFGATALVTGVILAEQATRFAEDHLFADRVVYRDQTPYQRMVVTRDETTGEHRLYLDGHLQFAEFDEYRYHEALVHPVMSVSGTAASVLVLGGGDGLAIREILRHPGVQRVTLVDLDPAVVSFCRTFPAFRALNGGSLDDPRVRLHYDDAFTFLRKTGERFDRIIADLPDPHNAALSKLYSVEFYRLAVERLTPGGAIVTQASSPYHTVEVYWSIADTMEAAGLETLSYHVPVPSFGEWGFHLAATGGIPTPLVVPLRGRYLTSEVLAAAQVFGPDLPRGDARVNSIFEPRLYRLYRLALQRGRPQSGSSG